MIETKQMVIDLLPTLYETLNAPVFLLNQAKQIIASPQQFIQFSPEYFFNIIQEDKLNTYKIFTYFSKKEVYFLFCCHIEDIHYICIGPYLTQQFFDKNSPSSYSFLEHVTSSYTIQDLAKLPYLTLETRKHISLIYQLLTDNTISSEEFKLGYQKPKDLEPEVQDSMDNLTFEIREDPMSEYSYAFEQKLSKAIMDGNSVDARLLATDFIRSNKAHILSKTKIFSVKFNVVAAITLFTRYVITAGVPIPKAYAASDVYIRKVDLSKQADELYDILFESIVDFTRMVKRYRDLQNPLWVKTCKEYIAKNLHQRIKLDDLSSLVSMNPNYLSVQFKKITGTSVKEYINIQKIKEAQFLLKSSNYSINEISVILDFASQSHLTKTFKELTGQTPLEYKNSK